MASFLGATTRAGWFTGTITVTDRSRFSTLYYSVTAMDNRNSAGTTGTISLVSPHLRWVYYNIGGDESDLRPRNGGASYSRMSLRFLPEPTRLLLLATGMLGLCTLPRLRRSVR